MVLVLKEGAAAHGVRLLGRIRGIRDTKDAGMAGKIVIDTERCKGCGLCITVCPKNSIVISQESNQGGYFPAEAKNAGCTACAQCAVICPEAAIEVYRQDADTIRIVAAAGKRKTPHLVDEKR
jgi:2-oxoglutarate ferredoxin oxidoreductase subunit delta